MQKEKIQKNKKRNSKIIAFIDYANMKAWAKSLNYFVDLSILYKALSNVGISQIRLYYGTDARNEKSKLFLDKLSNIGYGVITKTVQYFRISLSDLLNKPHNKRWVEALPKKLKESMLSEAKKLDNAGIGLFEPKANFDVEITLDALRYIDNFDHVVLFSGDGDFVPLLEYLRFLSKKTTILSGKRYLSGELRQKVNTFAYLEQLNDIISFIGPYNASYKKPQPALVERAWKECISSIASLLGLSNGNVDNKDN